MTVLIKATSENGLYGRRCDARCHNAKKSHCRCICGGRNHGIGYVAAAEKTGDSEEEIVDENRKFNLVFPENKQTLLF